MRRHNQHIMELVDSDLSKHDLTKPARNFDKTVIKKMIKKTQKKHDELYVARFDTQNDDHEFEVMQKYDEYLDGFIDAYLNQFNDVREIARVHFHQEMTLAYCIDECIALLHRKFENRQDENSMVTVDFSGQII